MEQGERGTGEGEGRREGWNQGWGHSLRGKRWYERHLVMMVGVAVGRSTPLCAPTRAARTCRYLIYGQEPFDQVRPAPAAGPQGRCGRRPGPRGATCGVGVAAFPAAYGAASDPDSGAPVKDAPAANDAGAGGVRGARECAAGAPMRRRHRAKKDLRGARRRRPRQPSILTAFSTGRRR